MQFTLGITIVLVVLVIFAFLRSVWATIIPGVTVPLALLGACALMWIAGYSLDNLSLMALTISVGFVVDDAIVMLENITRHIEEGVAPFEAALQGAGEIGFTIFSISLSLIAVLIPLLLMGGIIGRLFREFSVVLAMTILVSAFVSLTLTPMMASRFLKAHDEEQHGRLFQMSERVFDRMLAGYETGLDLALRYQFATLCIFLATTALTVYLFTVIPKGFFPQQDTGLITGQSEAAQDISFADMARHQQEIGRIVHGGSGRRQRRHERRRLRRDQPRPVLHHAEAARRADSERRSDHCAAAAAARQGRGRASLHAGGAGRARRRPHLAHAVPADAAGCGRRRAQHLGDADPRQAEDAAAAAGRCHRPAEPGHHADLDDRPRPGLAARHPAAGDRRHAL